MDELEYMSPDSKYTARNLSIYRDRYRKERKTYRLIGIQESGFIVLYPAFIMRDYVLNKWMAVQENYYKLLAPSYVAEYLRNCRVRPPYIRYDLQRF